MWLKYNFSFFSGEIPIHEGEGFTGPELPNYLMTAESGEMTVRFTTDAVKNTGKFSAKFSADCPPLEVGRDAVPLPGSEASVFATAFGSKAAFTCPEGQVFATGAEEITTECRPGGKWTKARIPDCQVKKIPLLISTSNLDEEFGMG